MTDPISSPGAPGPSASLHIDASPIQLYDLVTDIAQMGRLSPECTGGRWLDGATGPSVGARFKGTNKRGIFRWSTTNLVVEAEPGAVFSFETIQSSARWTYRFEPEGEGTSVTESREMFKPRTAVAKVFTKLALGGEDAHDDELNASLLTTLQRLKDLAESA